ncbi:MAG: hypothetical protein LBT12_05490 [Oscillospiraceae bacterium]|jgi:hypothetical protein|nr:hypothetical protein [Oscillospiraceae bacterium]
MEKNNLREAFDALNPTEAQKERILCAVLAQNEGEMPTVLPMKRRGRAVRRAAVIAACVAGLLAAATAANAATDGRVFGELFGSISILYLTWSPDSERVANYDGSEELVVTYTISVSEDYNDGKWLVEEEDGALVITHVANGERFVITDATENDEYYFANFSDAEGTDYYLSIEKISIGR